MSSSCTLVADRTDDAVQMLLGFIALSSLYAKWHFERPRRCVKVWFMDAMKQGTSAAMIHIMNILYAIGLADFSDTPSDQDQCAFYFMNVVIDTTLGVYIAYLLLQLSTLVAIRQQWTSLRCHGYYGAPPSWKVWWLQLLEWCTILIIMKLFVGVVLYAFSTPLGWMGSLLFYPVHNHPKIELLIVMIGCPLVMNMVQFWIQDSFLMDHGQQSNEELPLLESSVVGTIDIVQKPRGMSNVSSAADMYEILSDYVQKTTTETEAILEENELEKEDVDHVVLVGGSTRIPLVQNLVKKYFEGKTLHTQLSPDEAVAFGATIEASCLAELVEAPEPEKPLNMVNVVPLNLSVALANGSVSELIQRSTVLPASATELFTTSADNHEAVFLQIYEGQRLMAKDNTLVAQLSGGHHAAAEGRRRD